MRKALYQYLTNYCQSITTWHQPYAPTKSTQKPYGVFIVGETTRSPFNKRASYRNIYVWPYLEEGSFVDVDDVVAELRVLLDGTTLTRDDGTKFTLEWEHETQDFFDPDLEAITRQLTFRVPMVGVR